MAPYHPSDSRRGRDWVAFDVDRSRHDGEPIASKSRFCGATEARAGALPFVARLRFSAVRFVLVFVPVVFFGVRVRVVFVDAVARDDLVFFAAESADRVLGEAALDVRTEADFLRVESEALLFTKRTPFFDRDSDGDVDFRCLESAMFEMSIRRWVTVFQSLGNAQSRTAAAWIGLDFLLVGKNWFACGFLPRRELVAVEVFLDFISKIAASHEVLYSAILKRVIADHSQAATFSDQIRRCFKDAI